MENRGTYIDRDDLARRMWGRYLQNEWKYDKFGALGKLILLQEVVREAGAALPPGIDPQGAVNEVFPRTFYCARRRPISPPAAKTIRRYFGRLETEFTEQGLPAYIVQEICFSETAEKFCLPIDALEAVTSSH